MNTPNLDKRLKHHDQMCKMHVYSLGEERTCTCGKDSALIEMGVLVSAMEWLVKAGEYLDKNDSVASNSLAGAELRDIIERAKHERIIGTKPPVRKTRK